jgi:hypothetical protein
MGIGSGNRPVITNGESIRDSGKLDYDRIQRSSLLLLLWVVAVTVVAAVEGGGGDACDGIE